MTKFLIALVSGDEAEVDSVVFGALLALLAFIGIMIYVAVKDANLFNPVTYSTSALTIIGAGAGGKTLRDKVTAPGNGQQ